MTRPDIRPVGLSVDPDLGFLRQGELKQESSAVEPFREWFGFVPNLVLARTLVPRLIEAEVQIARVFLYKQLALSRLQKELILFVIAVAHDNCYSAALHHRALLSLGLARDQLNQLPLDYRQANLPETDVALLDFALRLGRQPTWTTRSEVEELRMHGFGDEHILEAVLTTSWGGYLSTLSAGLGVRPDSDPVVIPSAALRRTAFQAPLPRDPGEARGPYLAFQDLPPESFPPFAFVREQYGFIPNLYRAQTLRPDFVEAELGAVNLWLLTSDILSRRQKEYIFLAVSAANLNTYCVAAHCELLRGLGVSEEESEQIAINHHDANLSNANKALLDVCLKLARHSARFCGADIEVLRKHAFSEQQILEAVTIVAITNFFNTLDTGLGVEPDFESKVPLGGQKVHLSPASSDLMEGEARRPAAHTEREDPDADYVARVQAGDSEAFEELVRRHGRRVSRTLAAMLRQSEDVEDAVQDTFVKAFQHIGEFQGRSRFSTWLTRIAVNTGLHRLRGKREFESLDAGTENLDQFRPRQLRAWQDDPERSYSKLELRELVWKALQRLPLKYRIVVILRDLQQLSTAETASALGLEISGVKIRLFRGRLMLREALALHFTRKDTKRAHG